MVTFGFVAGDRPDSPFDRDDDGEFGSGFAPGTGFGGARVDADLQLAMTLSATEVKVGDALQVTLAVSNRGPLKVTEVLVGLPLPDGLAFLAFDALRGGYDPETGILQMGDLSPGASHNAAITLVATAEGPIEIVGEIVRSDLPDPDSTPANGSPVEDDLVALALTVDPAPISSFQTGTPEDDNLDGTSGVDQIRGLAGNDEIVGGAGPDELLGQAGDDLLLGGAGRDQLRGGRGDDILSGGPGDDILIGGKGDDLLRGGPGDDLLTGGPGADVFALTSFEDGFDTVRDFAPGIDALDVSEVLADNPDATISLSTSASDTVVVITDGNGALTGVQLLGVSGVDLADLITAGEPPPSG